MVQAFNFRLTEDFVALVTIVFAVTYLFKGDGIEAFG
jgi:hypothetical protein